MYIPFGMVFYTIVHVSSSSPGQFLYYFLYCFATYAYYVIISSLLSQSRYLLFPCLLSILILTWLVQPNRLGMKYIPNVSQQRGKTPPITCPGYETKLSDCGAPVLWLWGICTTPSWPLIPDLPWPVVVAPDLWSNRIVWHLNYEQTNDLCLIELLEKELFYH